jgi:predicted enzyme related to lactoylglutathione lyase
MPVMMRSRVSFPTGSTSDRVGKVVAIAANRSADRVGSVSSMGGVRLRQAVLVAADLEPVTLRLREELGLGEPFADPGVGEFGLRNAVYAIGDTFLEVIAPARDGTAAGRHLERQGGDGGYMLIFQVDDLDAARERVRDLGVRVVWQIDLPDISGTHLHPADTRGALLSLDRPKPLSAWRWGGPGWEERSTPGAVLGVTVAVRDPDAIAERWAAVLGAHPAEAGVRFAADDAERGLTGIELAGAREPVEIGGVQFTFVSEEDR